MQTRRLGNSGIEIVPLMLGGNVFGWSSDEATSFAVLDAFADRGFNAIDTANIYSAWVPGHAGGESEAIIGKWFARSGQRDKVVLATKTGLKMGSEPGGLKRDTIIRSVDDSLRRLQTDYIDLFQSHTDDEQTPLEETLRAYEELIQSGKIRAIGASNYKGARLRESMRKAEQNHLSAYVTLQPDYNMYDRKAYEGDLAPVVAEYGIGVIPYYSLAAGFLTGKYKSAEETKGTTRGSKVSGYFDARGKRILAALEKVAEGTNTQQASVALAWLLAQPNITAPIASATKPEQLEALFAAVDLQLSDAQLKTLNDASAFERY